MQSMLLELYEVEVSESLISSVTDAVLDDVRVYGRAAPWIRSIRSSILTALSSRAARMAE